MNVTANQAVTIRMIRHGVVTGSVMDTQGQVVRNAVVSAIPLPAAEFRLAAPVPFCECEPRERPRMRGGAIACLG
ncbi:MAG: hypothetical protein WDO18_20425 [Acidobacteriota bacterium]